ncbi:MAG: PQQ-dependent sugar dehydrogenase [Myxococcales bacterium]|nr:PQQ-dependent sugar dehydrogenase [Myxococcales bacterium]
MRNLASVVAVLSLVGACGGNKKSEPEDARTIDAPPACTSPIAGTTITARQIGQVPGGAMLATSPPGDPRLFVVDQTGLIRIFDGEQLQADAFLDISNDIVAGGEQGLLGLAFHPQYAANGLFFVYYTLSNANVIARCNVSATNPGKAMGCTPILSVPDFAGNHNGGMIEFGKDGYLYIGTGDGGGGGDPQRTAQNLGNLLGKILRIDVNGRDAGKEYAVPADNPFHTEVWMYGLRNPWRWSFDTNGDIWIGDVGQGVTEEVDVLTPSEQKGANLGWSIYEGTNCCMTQGDKCTQSGTQAACSPANIVMPKDSRTHGNGWLAIIGGQVYRGVCFPDMVGWYFYTDNSRGRLVKARLKPDGSLETVDVPGSFPNNPASLHADSRGELYITTATNPGRIYHLEASP